MSTLTLTDLSSLADKCAEISDELADHDGFVAVRELAARFNAELVLRPLLVEGMLASVEPSVLSSINDGDGHQWVIFVDSETYANVTEGDIRNEGAKTPLPYRMRNTVAHELVHSFAFRYTEFGVQLTRHAKSEKHQRDFIAALESETEKLSPLLLIPTKYLDCQFPRNKTDISIQDLQTIRRRMGVSRYVLVNRFNLLNLADKKNLLDRPGFRNLAVGIGEWSNSDEASFKAWPLFVNFDRNIAPEFLIKLQKDKLASLTGIFTDPLFCLCGGNECVSETTLRGGTFETPSAEEMKIACFVEPCARKKGAEFFFIVRSIVSA